MNLSLRLLFAKTAMVASVVMLTYLSGCSKASESTSTPSVTSTTNELNTSGAGGASTAAMSPLAGSPAHEMGLLNQKDVHDAFGYIVSGTTPPNANFYDCETQKTIGLLVPHEFQVIATTNCFAAVKLVRYVKNTVTTAYPNVDTVRLLRAILAKPKVDERSLFSALKTDPTISTQAINETQQRLIKMRTRLR